MNAIASVLAYAAYTAYAAYAAYSVPVAFREMKRPKKNPKLNKLTRRIFREFETPVSILWEVADKMTTGMQESLDGRYSNTGLKMLVSYEHELPNGDEEGLYHGVNLRATTFFILCARLHGKDHYESISDIHRVEIPIPPSIISESDNYEVLFDFIAKELARFVEEQPNIGNDDMVKKKNKLGFTISYPVDDDPAISLGNVIKWTTFSTDDGWIIIHGNDDLVKKKNKLGFTISYPVDDDPAISLGNVIKWTTFSTDDEVGMELVKIMNQALDNHGVNLEVSAMVEEAVGNLAAARYYDKDIIAAVTLDMGTDAVYIESKSAEELAQSNSSETVINFRWRNFEYYFYPMYKFDYYLQYASARPSKQSFEKMISGMYLGEIVRLILVRIGYDTKIFGDYLPEKLTTPYLLRLPDMLAMHNDTSAGLKVVGQKLNEIFGITRSTLLARELVAKVCDVVLVRAARLAGAGIVGMIKKRERIGKKRSVVSIEGTLCEHYIFRKKLENAIEEMLEDNSIIKYFKVGSDIGTIFLAASQSRIC